MNHRNIGARLRSAALAGLAGWLAAFAATLPMQWIGIYLRADGDARGLGISFAMGAFVWALWTLMIVAVGLLCAVVPIVLFARESWLLEDRRRTTLIAGGAAWAVLLIRFEVWKLVMPDHRLQTWIFCLYSLLLVVFAAVTAAVYLRLIARSPLFP